MRTKSDSGFTLVELLAVIAIISILAGLMAVALPRALERAQVADVISDFKALQTSMADYYAQYESYPLGYGFRHWTSRQVASPEQNNSDHFNFIPYIAMIGFYNVRDLYDRFGYTIDTNNDQYISPLEFSPEERFFDGREPYQLWTGGSVDNALIFMDEGSRPYVYAPVNLDKYERFIRIIKQEGEDVYWDGERWPDTTNLLGSLISPRYDAYVLISVGPGGNSGGLVVPRDEPGFIDSLPDALESQEYHALAMRTYYLATRDANKNSLLDFDYLARTRQKEGSSTNWPDEPIPGFSENVEPLYPPYRLPDGTNGMGPIIFHQFR